MRQILALVLMILLISLMASCAPRILPSRSLVVDLEIAEASHEEVRMVIASFLRENEFSPIGKGGYDDLSHQNTALGYQNSSGVQVHVDISYAQMIYVRMNTRHKEWGEEVEMLFEELASVLYSYWPNAMNKDPSH